MEKETEPTLYWLPDSDPIRQALPEYPTLKENRRSEFIIIMTEDDLKKYNDFAKTVDINKETN